ncbi:MAG: O-antigen export protein [Parcubacteria bacterium C7867-001]|nr:MAG: O-antigen export protein [Parcubacteria bacterium C7867-001]
MLRHIKERAATALRSTERYTKTDMVYLVTNGGWLTFAQIAIGLIAFLLSIAFANFVPKDVYGDYRFLISIFWTLSAFSMTGLAPALSRAVAKGEDGSYGSAVRLSILWSIPMALVGMGIAGYYATQGNFELAGGALIIALIGPFWQGSYFFGSFLEGKQAFRENAIAGILLNLIPAALLLAAMFLARDALVFLSIYLGASILTAFGISWYVSRKYGAAKTPLSAEAKNLSGHFSIMSILSTLAQQIDNILVYHYLGAVELALYSFATAIPDQMKVLFNTVATIALPRFVKRPLAEIQQTFWYRFAGFSALAIVATLLYVVLAPLFFQIFFPTYADAVPYSQLFALSLIPIGAIIPVTILEAHAKKRELYIYNVLGPVFQIVSMFIGIVFYGLVGLIVARIVSRVFGLILGGILIRTAKGGNEVINPV